MSTHSIAKLALDSFAEFARQTPSTKLSGREQESLAGYIHAWVESGRGIHACQADYPTYLVAVIAIIEFWHKRPEVLNYEPEGPDGEALAHETVERRVRDIFPESDDLDGWPQILDPHFFAAFAFYELRGRREEDDPR